MGREWLVKWLDLRHQSKAIVLKFMEMMIKARVLTSSINGGDIKLRKGGGINGGGQGWRWFIITTILG